MRPLINGLQDPHSTRTTLRIFVALFLVFLAISSGRLHSMDDQTNFYVARSLWRHGNPAIDVPPEERHLNTVTGVDGRHYSYYGIGGPLIFTPFVAAGEIIGDYFGAPHYVAQAAMSLSNAVATALTAAVIFLLLSQLRWSPGVALITTLFYALSSIALVWSKYPSNSSLVGLLFLAAIIPLRHKKATTTVWAGFLLGLAVNVRYDAAPGALIIPLLCLWRRDRPAKRLAWLVAGALPFVAILLWHNALRFGSCIELGYSNLESATPFGTPLSTGLHGLVTSPTRGILWYSPIFLLLPFAWWRLWKTRREFTVLFMAPVLFYLVFFAKAETWHAGLGWGPRYLGCVLPLMACALAALFPMRRAMVIGVLMVALLSFSIQVWGTTVSIDSYHDLLVERGVDPLQTAFDQRLAPLWGIAKVAGNFNLERIPRGAIANSLPQGGFRETRILRFTPDYWPFYAYKIGWPGWLVGFLWSIVAISAGVILVPLLRKAGSLLKIGAS